MKRWIALTVLFASVAALSVGIPMYSRTHDDVFTSDELMVAAADELKATVVTPHTETPIAPGRNVLWCGSFQLVWNEICALVGEDIHFTDDPPMLVPMNKKTFTRADIDEASHVSLAGFVGDGIFEKIPRALAAKFGGRARPRYLPPKDLTPRPQDIVGYAYLFKHLEFAVPFERLEEPLDFQGTPLPAFGLLHYKAQLHNMYAQVVILDYRCPDESDRSPTGRLACRAARKLRRHPRVLRTLQRPGATTPQTPRQQPGLGQGSGGAQCRPEHPVSDGREGRAAAFREPPVFRL